MRVLVVCTGNSARSQIAEALLTVRGAGRIEAASAGSQPAEAIHPLAVRVLEEIGISWQGRKPRGLAGVRMDAWDLVITVCDSARDACPVFPGHPLLVHWGLPDPARLEGDEEGRLQGFRETCATLSQWVDRLLLLPLETLDRTTARESIAMIGETGRNSPSLD